MNRKQFFLVVVALAVVGGAGLVLLHRNRDAWLVREAKTGGRVFPGFQINDVASIHVQGDGSDFNIIHANDLWCVRERDDYPADFALIRDFLLRVRDLTIVQSDLIGPSQLARLDLNPPEDPTNGATLVELKDAHGLVLASLLAGKKHLRPQMDGEPLGLHGLFDGRYLLLPHDPQNALLVSDELAAVVPSPGLWLSQDFFKVDHARYISLSSPKTGESWEISRADDTSPWTLANPRPGESLNTVFASDLSQIFQFPTFEDVAQKTPSNLAEAGLQKPTVITVLTDDFAYTLKVGSPEPNGDYPMTVNVEGSIPAAAADAADLRRKFAREKALAPWIFEAGHWLDRIIAARPQLIATTPAAGGQTAAR